MKKILILVLFFSSGLAFSETSSLKIPPFSTEVEITSSDIEIQSLTLFATLSYKKSLYRSGEFKEKTLQLDFDKEQDSTLALISLKDNFEVKLSFTNWFNAQTFSNCSFYFRFIGITDDGQELVADRDFQIDNKSDCSNPEIVKNKILEEFESNNHFKFD